MDQHSAKWRIAWLLVVAGIVCSGCVATQKKAPDLVLGNLNKIAIVAIEAPPIFVHPETDADRKALAAAGLSEPASAGDPWAVRLSFASTPGLLVGAAIDLAGYARSSTPRPGDYLVLTQDDPSPWMPTVQWAAHAATIIGDGQRRQALVIKGYARLPIADRTANASLESWLAVGRRWYNADVSMLSGAVSPVFSADAILQVGVLSYEYFSNQLVLQVMVKLVDADSGRVVARAREYAAVKAESVAVMMQSQGERMRELVDSTGRALLGKCLHDIGLAP